MKSIMSWIEYVPSTSRYKSMTQVHVYIACVCHINNPLPFVFYDYFQLFERLSKAHV